MKIKTKRGARRIRNQSVVCKRFVVTDYTGCSYITDGKWYKVLRTESSAGLTMIYITDDEGDQMLIRMFGNFHLGLNDWHYVTI